MPPTLKPLPTTLPYLRILSPASRPAHRTAVRPRTAARALRSKSAWKVRARHPVAFPETEGQAFECRYGFLKRRRGLNTRGPHHTGEMCSYGDALKARAVKLQVWQEESVGVADIKPSQP